MGIFRFRIARLNEVSYSDWESDNREPCIELEESGQSTIWYISKFGTR
jgi:hypothetical protein